MTKTTLMLGDCLDKLKDLEDNSIDSIVTDPPYGLGFMGKKWDIGVPAVEVFEECLRVLKPGGHLLAFGGSRTYHRLAVAVEDAGFEIRDQIMWIYGSGFPKSHNISKGIDKAAGAEREVIGPCRYEGRKPNGHGPSNGDPCYGEYGTPGGETAPATPEARQWEGWGTALKPAHEPIVLARKPFKGTVASNVLEHGTDGVNVDGCRIETEDKITIHNAPAGTLAGGEPGRGSFKDYRPGSSAGRWPANLIHDGSPEATAGMGNAAKYFYSAKASKKDRGEGNTHPTVKPTALMRYLCRLITPPGGTVLDPFMVSGSTGKAAVQEGFDFVGIEMDPEYLDIATARIAHAV